MQDMNQKTMCGVLKESPAPGAVYRTDLPVPKVGPNDILVKIRAVAICGTDLHIMEWNAYASERVPAPMVFGHEFSGDIVEVGSNVTEFKVGDRIAAETHIPCNHCQQCVTGHRHICENMKIIGVHVPGAFAEYISIPQDCAYKIADSVSYKMGAMLEPMGVGVHGVSVADVEDKNVVIFGCGPIGLMAIGAAKVWGAKKIVAVDVFDDKLEIAKKMGAAVCVNSKFQVATEIIPKAFDGAYADVVIDYTGANSAILQGLASVKKGGKMVLVGLTNKELSLDLSNQIIYKELTIVGVTGRLMYQTWKECEEILESDDFHLDAVVGGIYPLESFQSAFDDIQAGKPGKMILVPRTSQDIE